MLKKTIFVLTIVAIALACYWLYLQFVAPPAPLKRTQFLMDTIVEVTAYGKAAENAEAAAFHELQRLHKVFDNFDPNSDVSRINANAGIEPVQVARDIIVCIKRSREFGTKLNGTFDVSIGPLIDLWGIGRKGQFVPTAREIEKLLPLVGEQRIVIDEKHSTVFLPVKGMRLDFGGVAKGYACDRMVDILKQHGVESALINAGGDVRVIGRKPDGQSWTIGVQDPRQTDGIIATLAMDKWDTMETSGDYQRYIEVQGKRYSHILDPRSGYQPHSVAAVTIVGNSSFDDDILSTALFILGVDKGKELLEKNFPGTAAICTTRDDKVVLTDGLVDVVHVGR